MTTPAGDPGIGRMVARALVRRCPHCGGGGIFERWLKVAARCPTCGLRFERQEGFMLGSMSINIIVTFLAIAGAVALTIALQLPDVAMVPPMVVGLLTAVIVPLAFYPLAVTLWLAFELAVRPLEGAELADAEAHRAGRGPGPA